MPNYIVIAKSRPSATFYPPDALLIETVLGTGATVSLAIQQKYMNGYSAPLPVELQIEAKGQANSLREAVRSFHDAMLEVMDLAAFATNCDLGKMEIEQAYDCTPDTEERDFQQTFIPGAPILYVVGRPINPTNVRDFLAAVAVHPQRESLQKAIVHYCEALHRWTSGEGLMCVVYLYIGVEALIEDLLADHHTKNGTTDQTLMDQWGIDHKGQKHFEARRQLMNQARLRLVFGNDKETYEIARDISNGFEHGYRDFRSMHGEAAQVVVKFAGYVRKAIVELACGSGEFSTALLASPWDEPRGPLKLIRTVHGKLVDPSNQFSAQGHEHPILNWTTRIDRVEIAENGRFGFVPSDSFTPQFGPGVQFRPQNFEVWDNQLVDKIISEEANKNVLANPMKIDPVITRSWSNMTFGEKLRSVIIGLSA